MKQDVRRVRDKPIALGQERVCAAEHNLIACGALRFCVNKIGNPPGTDLTNEEQGIGNPKPAIQPSWIGLTEIPRTEKQTYAPRHTLYKSHENKSLQRVLAAYCGNVVQTPKRNP